MDDWEIAKLLNTKTQGKGCVILFYFFAQVLRPQKRLIFSFHEFYRWCKGFANVSKGKIARLLQTLVKKRLCAQTSCGLIQNRKKLLDRYGARSLW